MRSSKALPVVLLGILVAGTIGWVFGVIASDNTTPASLIQATPAEVVPVTTTSFTDPQSVQLSIVPSVSKPVVTNALGMITAFSCSAGAAVNSGEIILTVNDTQIVNLATRIPLWRELNVGSRGEDVQSLQEELVRLGYSISTDGKVGSDTITAISQLRGAKVTSIQPADFLWLPSASGIIEKCEREVGGSITSGEVMFYTQLSFPTVSVQEISDTIMMGKRILEIGGKTYPLNSSISSDDVIIDPIIIKAVLDSSEYLGVEEKSGEVRISAVIKLATATQVSSVPPSAILTNDEGYSCVVTAEGDRTGVTIMSSQLGQTFISFSGQTPKEVLVKPSPEFQCR